MFTREIIQAVYDDLGFRRGWTFMATPEQRMQTSAVVIVGLNPGGGGPSDTHQYGAIWDTPVDDDHPTGNAYADEHWAAGGGDTPVQQQVMQWHRAIGCSPADSFCAQFVPFRSPDWERLDNRADALRFGRRLWAWVLDRSPASLFVTMGKQAGAEIAALLDARRARSFPTGWGRQTIDLFEAPGGARRVVAMPHPSRYRLLGRGGGDATAAQSFAVAIGRPHTSPALSF